MINVSKIKDSK